VLLFLKALPILPGHSKYCLSSNKFFFLPSRSFLPVLLLSLCLPLNLWSQEYLDVLHVTYGISPGTRYDQEFGTTATTTVHHTDLTLTLPLPISPKITFITGLIGFGNRLQLDPQIPGTINLYSATLPLGLRFDYGNQWFGTHVLMPRRSTAFNNSRAGFQVATAHLFQRQKDQNTSFTMGFYLSQESYGAMLVPLFGLYYKDPSDRVELQLLLPARGDINYSFSENFRMGVVFDGLGSTHDLQTGDYGDAYVQRISNDLQGYAQVNLSKTLLLSMRAGYAFFRSFRVYDAEDKAGLSLAGFFANDPRNALNTSVEGGLLFSFRLTYRVML
jgi:hypothetical protein